MSFDQKWSSYKKKTTFFLEISFQYYVWRIPGLFYWCNKYADFWDNWYHLPNPFLIHEKGPDCNGWYIRTASLRQLTVLIGFPNFLTFFLTATIRLGNIPAIQKPQKFGHKIIISQFMNTRFQGSPKPNSPNSILETLRTNALLITDRRLPQLKDTSTGRLVAF